MPPKDQKAKQSSLLERNGQTLMWPLGLREGDEVDEAGGRRQDRKSGDFTLAPESQGT